MWNYKFVNLKTPGGSDKTGTKNRNAKGTLNSPIFAKPANERGHTHTHAPILSLLRSISNHKGAFQKVKRKKTVAKKLPKNHEKEGVTAGWCVIGGAMSGCNNDCAVRRFFVT